MYISMSRLRLPEAHVAELLDAFENRAHLVESAEGFVELEVWHSDRDPGEVIMVSRWSTRDAFTAYMKSEDHQTSHARIAPSAERRSSSSNASTTCTPTTSSPHEPHDPSQRRQPAQTFELPDEHRDRPRAARPPTSASSTTRSTPTTSNATGPPDEAWCEHDSRYLIAWALEDARASTLDCVEQVQWLARVLAERSFPIERLARHVELTAAILRTPELGDIGSRAADRLSHAASLLTNEQNQ